MSEHKVPFLVSFLRAQMTAICATSADFLTLLITKESKILENLCDLNAERALLVSTALATGVGAIVGFLLGRYWTFERTDRPFWTQAFKYLIASIIIMGVNVLGMHYLANMFGIQYLFSKIIIATLAGIFVSFPLFRYWVYR